MNSVSQPQSEEQVASDVASSGAGCGGSMLTLLLEGLPLGKALINAKLGLAMASLDTV